MAMMTRSNSLSGPGICGTDFTKYLGSGDRTRNMWKSLPRKPGRIGRRITLLAGVAVTCICLLLVASSFSSNSSATSGWQLAVNIDDADGWCNDPCVTMNSTGHAMVAWEWHSATGTSTGVRVNSYAPETGWNAAELIQINDTGYTVHPQVAMNDDGKAILVWAHYDGTRSDICASSYSNGWGEAEVVQYGTVDSESLPWVDVEIDPNGNAIAVWHIKDGQRNSIYGCRYVDGIGWEAPSLLEAGDGDAWAPQVAMDDSGDAVVVWFQFDYWEDVYACTYTVGVGWSTAEIIENDDSWSTFDPRVGVDSGGNAIAVWQQYVNSWSSVMANHYVKGVGWGTPVLIEANETGDAWSPEIAVNDHGDAIVVWQNFFGNSVEDNWTDIWANRYVVGSGWQSEELIEDNNTLHGWIPRVAIDNDGNGIAVWMCEDNNVSAGIWSNRYFAGSGWGSPERLSTADCNSSWGHQIAVNDNGDATAVWCQFDALGRHVWANRYSELFIPEFSVTIGVPVSIAVMMALTRVVGKTGVKCN